MSPREYVAHLSMAIIDAARIAERARRAGPNQTISTEGAVLRYRRSCPFNRRQGCCFKVLHACRPTRHNCLDSGNCTEGHWGLSDELKNLGRTPPIHEGFSPCVSQEGAEARDLMALYAAACGAIALRREADSRIACIPRNER
jgi:hypothetical protein